MLPPSAPVQVLTRRDGRQRAETVGADERCARAKAGGFRPVVAWCSQTLDRAPRAIRGVVAGHGQAACGNELRRFACADDAARANISAHLIKLKKSGLITSRTQSRAVYYHLTQPELGTLLQAAGQLLATAGQQATEENDKPVRKPGRQIDEKPGRTAAQLTFRRHQT